MARVGDGVGGVFLSVLVLLLMLVVILTAADLDLLGVEKVEPTEFSTASLLRAPASLEACNALAAAQ